MSVDKAFENQFLKEGSEVLKHVIPEMAKIWKQLGFPPIQRQNRFKQAIFNHKELWDSMLEEEQKNLKKISINIDRLIRQIQKLCEELGTHYIQLEKDMPLLEMEKQLQCTLSELNREKEGCMKSLGALFSKERILCSRLDVARCSLDRERISISEQCSKLELVINELETEIKRRQEQFVSIKDAIKISMKELEMSAHDSLYENLMSSDPCRVNLSESNLNQIKDIQQGLISRIKVNQEMVTDMWKTIQSLWDRLSVEPSTRQIFRVKNPGFAPSTIIALERELTCLEKRKRENVERFIRAERLKLIDWWDRCYVSDAERRNFTPFSEDVNTEGLLELHKAQVEKYKELYTNHENIFVMVKQHEDLWNLMVEMEEREKNADRLNSNRGAAVLQEQKKLTLTKKKLPRIEKELNDLLTDYEYTNRYRLLINGQDYRQVVVDKWVRHDEETKQLKLKSQQDRAAKLVEEAKGEAKPNPPMKRAKQGKPFTAPQARPVS